MDAAGADKAASPPTSGSRSAQAPRSPRSRSPAGRIFEAQVKANGGADLVRLLRDRLGLDLPGGFLQRPGIRRRQHRAGGPVPADTRAAAARRPAPGRGRHTVRPPDAAAAGRRPPGLPRTRRGRLPGPRQVPRRRDQVVRRHRRAGRRGERGRRRHAGSGLHPGAAGPAHRRVASRRRRLHRRHPGHAGEFLPPGHGHVHRRAQAGQHPAPPAGPHDADRRAGR